MMCSNGTSRRTLRVLVLSVTASLGLGLPALVAPLPAAPPAAPADAPAPATGGEVFAGWATAGLFRLEATRYAAEEAPLEANTKQKLIDRVARARAEVDAVAKQYAAGSLRTAAARKSADGILAQLKQDADALLGDQSAAFASRVEKTMADAQLFASRDPGNARVLLDAATKLTDEQKARIDLVLSDASARVKEIEAAGKPDGPALKHQVGFAARSKIRGLLTPEQLKALDGPFQAAAPAPAVPAAPTTATAGAAGLAPAGASEAKSVVLSRLEAMRYAALEGPFPPEAKVGLADRIAKARTEVTEGAAGGGAGAAGGGSADVRISRVYTDVLADASKLLGDKTADFLRRQNRIYQDVTDLSANGPWAGRAALEAVKLTDAQRGQVDQILARRAEQLKALTPPVDPTAPPPADPAAELAARALRRREVGFQTRAALRAVLTPEQQAAWDAATP